MSAARHALSTPRRFLATPNAGPLAPLRAVLSGLSIVSVSRLGAAGLALATQIYLAKILSADALGRFFLATSLGAFLAIIASCGFPMIAARFLVRYRGRRRANYATLFLRTVRIGSLLAALFLATAAIAAIHLWPGLDPDTRRIATIGSLAAPGFVLIRFGSAAAIAYRRFSLAYLPDLIGRPLLFLAAIGILALLGAGTNLTAILIAFVALALAHGVWQNTVLRTTIESGTDTSGDTATDARLAHHPARALSGRRVRQLARIWFAAALPLTGALLLMAAFADIIILTAGLFLAAADLAILGVCVKLAMIVAFIHTAAHKMLQVDLAEAMRASDRARLATIIGQANLIGLVVSISALGVVLLSGDLALSLFGAHFTAGQPILIALLAGQVIAASGGPAIQILSLGNGQRAAARTSLFVVAALIALNAVLTPAFGIAGAAIAIIATQMIWATLLAIDAHRLTGVRCDVLTRLGGRHPVRAVPAD